MATQTKDSGLSISRKKRLDPVRLADMSQHWLKLLVDTFNRMKNPNSGFEEPSQDLDWHEQRAYWLMAEEVVAVLCPHDPTRRQRVLTHEQFLHAVYLFNAYFKKFAFARLRVEARQRPLRFHCRLNPEDETGVITFPRTIAFYLWESVFLQKGYERLKRCHKCEKWFIDRGKNKIARFCSPKCTNQWWKRPRRYASRKFGKMVKMRKRHKGGI